MNGRLASFGMNTSQASPAAAEYAAAALPALPAVGSAIVVAPRYFARVIAADWPRALNELVGFSDSSLMYSRSSPIVAPSAFAWKSGVNPSPSVTGDSPSKSGSISRYRHMLASRPTSDSRRQARAASRSYRASSGAPQEQRNWRCRGSRGG